MESAGEILVLPFHGQGHLFPCVELCKHFSSRNYTTILIIPSHLSSSIPSSLHHHPFVKIAEISANPSSPAPPETLAGPGHTPEPGRGRGRGRGHGPNPFHHHHQELGPGLENLLSARSENPDQTRPTCVIYDVMMSWSKEIFAKFSVPTISFFTSGACSSAMEYAAWKAQAYEMKPGDVRILPGLPEDMALAYSDLDRRPRGPPGGHGSPPGLPSNGMTFGPAGSDRPGEQSGGGIRPDFPNDMALAYSDLDRMPRRPPAGHGSPPGPPPNGMKFDPAGSNRPGEPSGGGIRPDFPKDMALAYSDIDRRPHRPPGGHGNPPGPPPNEMKLGLAGSDRPSVASAGGGGFRPGPPGPGHKPKWLEEVEGSIAMLINTCDDLEHPFINYVATQTGKPVWGVGPLLPEKYWKSTGSLIHDSEIRSNGRKSNYTEAEVIQWLDSKPGGSTIYISFGSEVGPTVEEYEQLAKALEESNRPFIWVIQPNSGKSGPPPSFFVARTGLDAEEGYYPHGLDKKVAHRGLIIRGWAPQLLILSHPSTGGFLSHCGWNSTVEAIGRGVPFLAWPIRGDQFDNAKLLVSHLKVGFMVSTGGPSNVVKKEDILQGIERLMANEDVRTRAPVLRGKLENGFPASSVAALDALVDFIKQKAS